MPTRNVVLTDHQEALIEQLVGNGRFENASDVLRHGLRLVEHEAATQTVRLQRFHSLIQEGEDAYARGEYVELDSDAEVGAFMRSLDEPG